MAWIKTHYGDTVVAPISKFICDAVGDIANLPTDVVFGSEAIILTTGVKYYLGSNKTWAATSA